MLWMWQRKSILRVWAFCSVEMEPRVCVCACVTHASQSAVEIAGKSIKKGFRLAVSRDGQRVRGTEVSVLPDKKELGSSKSGYLPCLSHLWNWETFLITRLIEMLQTLAFTSAHWELLVRPNCSKIIMATYHHYSIKKTECNLVTKVTIFLENILPQNLKSSH